MLHWRRLILRNMSSKNKATLFSTIVILLIIIYAIFCIIFTKSLSPKVILALCLGIEWFYSLPLFVIYYYKFYERPLGSKTFIAFLPHFNVVSIMSSWLQVLSNIACFILLVSTLLLFTSSWLSIMPDFIVLNAQNYLPTIIVISFIIYNILVGIGLYIATVEIKNKFNESLVPVHHKGIFAILHDIIRYLPYIEVALLSLPMIRSASLILSIENMQTLCRLNYSAFTEFNEFNEDEYL